MTQLYAVLRKSIAHLPPDDPAARERVFASARQAMMRLLWSYEPPLTSGEIEEKIGAFDEAVGRIETEFTPDAETAPVEDEPELADAPFTNGRDHRAGLDSSDRTPWHDDPEPFAAPTRWRDEEPAEETFEDEGADHWSDEEIEAEEEAGHWEEPPARPTFLERTREFVDRLSPAGIAAAIGGIVIIAALAWCVWFLASLLGPGDGNDRAGPAQPTATETSGAAPNAPGTVVLPTTQPTERPGVITATTAAEDGVALETIVLFDGRDPTVFQSVPDNPVVFDGGPDGGFARISTSAGSPGTRLIIGRGAFERFTGRTIRIVVVARAAGYGPASSFRFAYQSGRALGPWISAEPTSEWRPYAGTWTVPAPRAGGPVNDVLLIEPGVPGDGTTIDVRSVRIEVLG